MNCMNCGAPMSLLLNKQQFKCEYCFSTYFPDKNEDGIRILDEESETGCPVCNIPLVYGYIDSVQTRYCVSCRGILIDQEVFLFVIDNMRAKSTKPTIQPPPVNLQELNRRIKCPRCGHSMSTHFYGGPGNLVVDNCVNCSILWLDNNEFNRVIRSPGRGARNEIDNTDN